MAFRPVAAPGSACIVSDITVTPMEPDHYGVQVTEGDVTTSHRVRVPPDWVDAQMLGDVDGPTLVRESIAFLLERESSPVIPDAFALPDISAWFDEYPAELKARIETR